MRKHLISFRSMRRCLIITLILLICFYTSYINYLHNCTKPKIKYRDPVNLNYVTVHMDLKGAPPKIEFMKRMLPELKKLGGNALLMEYEDMFPYQNQLVNLSKPQHYSRNELKDFLEEANNLGLEIIPLIQTFGHMESVLKLPKFKHLRENPKFMDSICPSRQETKVLINGMLKQVIEFHNSVVPLRHIHIGCDEVFKINTCEHCKKRRLSSRDIYVNHVNTVSNMVLNLSPNTTILIWDDMLRSLKISQWKGLKINPKVELVYWLYKNIPKSTHTIMYFYHKHNIRNIWIASAFKGAEGRTSVVPNYEMRTKNTLAWLNFTNNYVFAGENKAYSFKGIVLTGWSRYAHFLPLCDLLPVSYKSLVTSLLLVNKFKNGSRIVDINWKENWDTIFNNHFLTDYDVKVGCKGLADDSCILKSANSLFNSVESYEKLLKAIQVKTLRFAKSCHTTKNILTYHKLIKTLEDDLRFKMMPFYSSEIQNEYIDVRRNSTKLFSYLRKCLKSKIKNSVMNEG